MTDHSTPDAMPPARDEAAAYEIKRVLGQEMMSRRFVDMSAQARALQAGVLCFFIGVLLLMVLQQVVTSDPAMQIARQQRGAASATGSIGLTTPVAAGRSNHPLSPREADKP